MDDDPHPPAGPAAPAGTPAASPASPHTHVDVASGVKSAIPPDTSQNVLRRDVRWIDVVATLARVLATTTVLIVAYYWIPMDPREPQQPYIALLVWLVVLAGVIAAQVYGIVRAARPAFRAIESLVFVIVLFLLSFAAGYFEFSAYNPASFTQTMTRTDAIYFTVTVFATVGFGDITPVSQNARIVCTFQMLLDLVLIGAGVRVIVAAVRIGQARKVQQLTATAAAADPPPDPSGPAGATGA